MATYRIQLDTSKQSVPPKIVQARKGDAGSCVIVADVTEHGAPYDFAGKTARFECPLPNGTKARDDSASINGSTLTYTVPAEVLAIEGAIKCAYFAIVEGGAWKDTTDAFIINVQPGNGDALMPGDYVPEIDASLAAIRATDRAAADAEAERAAAESARATAETEREEAETGRSEAEEARVAAESARMQAETGRTTAEDARVAAENARITAEQARDQAEVARSTAETGRAEAESGRAAAETGRETAESKRKIDFADMMDAAQGVKTRILSTGEYDASGKPTVDGVAGVIYLVPVQGPTNNDLNSYVEWMCFSGTWEIIGGTATTIEPMTTDEVDAVIADESPTGAGVMDVTRLSYLWTRLKAAFAPLSHRHSGGDINDNSIAGVKLADGAVTAAKLGDKMLPVYIVSSDTEAVSRTPCLRAVVDASGTLQKLLFDEGGGS